MYHHIINPNSILMSKDPNVHKDRLYVEIKTLEEIARRGLDDIYSEKIEFGFTQRYYISTLHKFFCVGADLDYDLLRDMRREMLHRYPNYGKNQTIIDCLQDGAFCFLLGTLEMDLSQDDWDRIAEAYRNERYDIRIYMSDEKALEWLCSICDEFLEFGISILEMMLNYGTNMKWGSENQRDFLKDYRDLWDMFVDVDRRFMQFIKRYDMIKNCSSYDKNKMQEIWDSLYNAVGIQAVMETMEDLILQLEQIKIHYNNIKGELL